MKKSIFVTGTDTGVGKTIVTYVLGVLLQNKGLDVGVMKPVQCGGHDAAWLKDQLDLQDSLQTINPYFAKEPLSPHLAFQREHRSINFQKIISHHTHLKQEHDILLVEGAGGLMVPLQKNYLVADLIKDMNCEVIIVSRLGLGTINHTLLTIEHARAKGLKILGVIFNETKRQPQGIPEKTNPNAIKEFGKVSILGTVPYFSKWDRGSVVENCLSKIDMKRILKGYEK